MSLQRSLMWMRAHTFVHVGVGQVAALVDLPFVRESATGYPYIPGSGLKGALRDNIRLIYPPTGNNGENDDPAVTCIFGWQDKAGAVLVADARLAFLPVRSLDAAYLLITCPYLLRRLARDRCFAGLDETEIEISQHLNPDDDDQVISSFGANNLFVEDFYFSNDTGTRTLLQEKLKELLEGIPEKDAIIEHAVILNDKSFKYFARRSLHVRIRNHLDAITKTVIKGQLWSEESLPPESLLYSILMPRNRSCNDAMSSLLDTLGKLDDYIQVGGNETVGEGWFKLSLIPVPVAEADGDAAVNTQETDHAEQ